MNISFRNMAILFALLFFALALTWMFAPGVLLSSWGVDLSSQVGVAGRRGAALYAGVGILFLSARNVEPSPTRSALLRGATVICLLLAAVGTYELVNGHTGPGLLVAIGTEIVLATAFLPVSRQ